MPDTRLEEHIRSTLASEGDAVPVTITTAELERRLALRRRDRNGRRLTLMAAAIAAIAVGSIVALGNGWLRLPSVGVDPSPSPAPTRQSQDGASTLGPIGVTPGRQELFRADPDDTAERPMQPFVVPAAGDWVLGTIACLGDGEVRQSIEPDVAVNVHCLPDQVVESEGWFAVIDGQVRGSLAGSGDVRYAFLLESPGPGDTPPVTEPPATPTPTPVAAPRVTPDLGGPSDAVLVRTTDGQSPRLGVTVAKSTGENVDIGDFPIPDGVSFALDRARVGPTGYLAIPVDALDVEPDELMVYDLANPSGEPVRVQGATGGFGWSPDGSLTVLDALTVSIVDPADGAVTSATPVPAGVIVFGHNGGPIWAADGSGVLASRVGVASTEQGILGLDGGFVPVTSPEVFAPTGLERLSDRDGRTLATGCDSSGAGGPGASCSVTISTPGVEESELLYSGDDIADHAWAADGQSAWLLLDDHVPDEAAGDLRLQRGTVGALVAAATLSDVVRRDASSPRFAGFTSTGNRMAIRVDDETTLLLAVNGQWYTFDGGFAGWADQTGATYPAP